MYSAWLSRVALGLLLLGTVGMIASMLIGVADVVGTKFLDRPVLGTLEFTESTMVLIVFGALAYAQERRAHIRVELLYGFVGARQVVHGDGRAQIVALIFFGLVAWQGFGELLYSWEMKEATMGSVRFPALSRALPSAPRRGAAPAAPRHRHRAGHRASAARRAAAAGRPRADGIRHTGAPVAAGCGLDRGGPAAPVAHARRAYRRGARPGRIRGDLPHRRRRCGAGADPRRFRSAPPIHLRSQ